MCMTVMARPSHFLVTQIGLALLAVIDLTRAHLKPVYLTRGVYRRARQQLAGLEALLRRMLLRMALQIEHEITPDTSETTGFFRPRAATGWRPRSLRLLPPRNTGPCPDFHLMTPCTGPRPQPLALPVLLRIRHIQQVLEAPETHARRMAFRLARQRADDYVLIPVTNVNLRRLGTELSAMYPALGVSIQRAIGHRPPRVGPRPRPPPRIRQF